MVMCPICKGLGAVEGRGGGLYCSKCGCVDFFYRPTKYCSRCQSTRVLETGKEENCPVCKTSFKLKTWQEPKQEINLQVTTKPVVKDCVYDLQF